MMPILNDFAEVETCVEVGLKEKYKELRALRGFFGPPMRLKLFFTNLSLLVYKTNNQSVKV